MVNPILNDLKHRLHSIGKPHQFISSLIGRGRIIILPDASQEDTTAEEVSVSDLSGEELRQLRYLASLEDSFTGRTACLLLTFSGVSPGQASPHEILEKFLRKGTLR